MTKNSVLVRSASLAPSVGCNNLVPTPPLRFSVSPVDSPVVLMGAARNGVDA